MTDLSATLTALAAGLVAVLAAALVAGGLFWLTVRLVNAVGRRHSTDPLAVSPVGYPKALAAAVLVLLAQAVAGGAVLAPATAFAKVDWTVVGPGLVTTAALAAVTAALAAVVVSGLILSVRGRRAAAVGLIFGGLSWAIAGGLLTARRLAA